LFACTDDPKPPPLKDPDPTTIHVTSTLAPALVAFRDGFDAKWQSVTPATAFDIKVKAAYAVVAVCQEADAWRTWQFARVPDDGDKLELPCAPPAPAPARHAITGHALRSGVVHLGDSTAQSKTDNWDFTLQAPDGTYDLVAVTSIDTPQVENRIVMRRGIAVAGDLALTPAIDIEHEGGALAHVELKPAKELPKDSKETLQAVVEIETAHSLTPAQVYVGAPATALVVPADALQADDHQTVTLQAVLDGATHGLRREFKFGDKTEFALPSKIGSPKWGASNSDLYAALPLLPKFDTLQLVVTGASGDGAKAASYEFDISQGYLDDTMLARPTLDTAVPGYKAEWRVDVSKTYSRQVSWQHELDDGGVEFASDGAQIEAK
jgi:hypothetical protein